MSVNKFVFVGNGSYQNKGCEAIVRGTVEILRDAFGSGKYVNANFDVQNPPYMPDESDPSVTNQPLVPLKKWSAHWMMHQALLRTMPNAAWDIYFRKLKPLVADASAVLSVGGDNYTLDYGIPKTYIALDDYLARNGKPLIIWGASVGPFDTNASFAPIMHKHLREKVRAIFVREERSLEYLKRYHVTEKAFLAPDPAFVMSPVACSIDDIGFELPDAAIGVNLSPLLTRFVNHSENERFVSTAQTIVATLRDTFRRPIILIPHVTSPHSDDYALLSDVYAALESKDDVHLLPPHLGAAQTKWVISKLGCLVAARTHATIAAFSTCVPTVSLAYSIKAYGINEMLFGHSDYVISPEKFCLDSVVDKVRIVLNKGDDIRHVLAKDMQKIKSDAMYAGQVLRDLLAV